MNTTPLIRYLVFGKLKREFILPPVGKPVIDQVGGSLLYAAAGLGLWDTDMGLVARASEDFPREWMSLTSRSGMDTRGIRFLNEKVDHRWFCAYEDLNNRSYDRPVGHFAQTGLPFPNSLLGYVEPSDQLDSRTVPTPSTLRSTDLPADYLDATAAHFCPLDFLSHSLLPSALRQGHITTITIDPAPAYMTPVFWDDIPHLVKGITAFLTSEEKLESLFQNRSEDLWEMAEALGSYGCEIIVIKRGANGQLIYEHATHSKWILPAYPARVVNPTGAGDAFCGGFLSGFKTTFNPIEGALSGNVAASMMIEGNTPFHPLDALPGLANARREALRETLRRV